MPWYIASVMSGSEIGIVRRSKQLFIKGWYPKRTVWKAVSRQKRKKGGPSRFKTRRPLFPGYVFVNIDLAKQLPLVLGQKNVFGVILMQGEPLELAEEIIDFLFDRQNFGEFDETKVLPKVELKIGKRYMLHAGFFEGRFAEVLSISRKWVEFQPGKFNPVKITLADFLDLIDNRDRDDRG